MASSAGSHGSYTTEALPQFSLPHGSFHAGDRAALLDRGQSGVSFADSDEGEEGVYNYSCSVSGSMRLQPNRISGDVQWPSGSYRSSTDGLSKTLESSGRGSLPGSGRGVHGEAYGGDAQRTATDYSSITSNGQSSDQTISQTKSDRSKAGGRALDVSGALLYAYLGSSQVDGPAIVGFANDHGGITDELLQVPHIATVASTSEPTISTSTAHPTYAHMQGRTRCEARRAPRTEHVCTLTRPRTHTRAHIRSKRHAFHQLTDKSVRACVRACLHACMHITLANPQVANRVP